MPSSLLLAINNEGRVFGLSTGGGAWREFPYLGLEFKQISACPMVVWAVGGDRQVYVLAHGFELPIRVREEAFENERWLPLEGFSGRLLPTDRYHFSNEDGTRDRTVDRIRLPSMAWQWEGDWALDLSLDGQPLDHDGWTYAVDFPAKYGPVKRWKSCVRRRKWVRYRRYAALNSWCAIAPLHKDPTQEPFIDVAVGGHRSSHDSNLSVWAITAHGRVMHRTGAGFTAPEGLRWSNVSVPPACEVKQISVGAAGCVWALLWTGRALVRKGVTRDCPAGDAWLEVRPPEDAKLNAVSVGYDAVWSVSADGRVWFRKGVDGATAGVNESSAIGKGWLEIGGNMAHISVTADDQVFGVCALDRCIYWRSGVTPAELSGKNWRMIQAPIHLSRAGSSVGSVKRSPRSRHRSLNSLNRPLSRHESGIASESWEESSRSAPVPRTLPLRPPSVSDSTPPISDTDETCSVKSNNQSNPDIADSGKYIDMSGTSFETTLKNPRAWSPVRSVGSVLAMEAHPETDSSVFDSDSSMFGDDESDHAALYWDECDAVWTLVEAGGCVFDTVQLPHWFADVHLVPQVELTQAWRLQILDDLKNRHSSNEIDVSTYEKAVDTKSWIRSGEARYSGGPNNSMEDCILSLECHSGSNGGTLTLLNTDGATTKCTLILSEITCVVSCSEAGCPRIAIYAPRRFKSPLKLQFSADTDQEEWLSILIDVTCQIHSISGRPSPAALWGTTAAGDVLAWDPLINAMDIQNDNLYIQEMDVFGKDTSSHSYTTPLYNTFSVGTELEISGCILDNADRVTINLQGHTHTQIINKTEKQIRDVAFHFNPRFGDGVIVRNSMKNGKWGDEERDGECGLKPGHEFHLKIVSDEYGYIVHLNGVEFTHYKHRIEPETVASLHITGAVRLFRITYRSKKVIVSVDDMVWRCMGGHLRRVEACSDGVVWGVGHDHTPWVYTGGWSGTSVKGLEKGKDGINQMTDIQNYFVYENQRWNPLSGYTGSGLPTDRYMWSDSTGKQKRTRELTKLLNRHWHWISDWLVDFHAPGGVDRDGWQYATDFPSTYHGKKVFTDCVRRRRWYRRAQLNTLGPWQEIGSTKIIDVSLWTIQDSPDNAISVWAIANNGDALFRAGVTKSSPAGSSWEHVTCVQPLCGISVGAAGVWAVGRKGESYWRMGVTHGDPKGTLWHVVEGVAGVSSLKQLSVGKYNVWAIDTNNKIVIRKDVTDAMPEGSSWHVLGNDAPDGSGGFRHVTVGESEVWVITTGGMICRRAGLSKLTEFGTGWHTGINAAWLHATSRGKSAYN